MDALILLILYIFDCSIWDFFLFAKVFIDTAPRQNNSLENPYSFAS